MKRAAADESNSTTTEHNKRAVDAVDAVIAAAGRSPTTTPLSTSATTTTTAATPSSSTTASTTTTTRFGAFESTLRSKVVLEDPLATTLLAFPSNDVRVLREPRASRQLDAVADVPSAEMADFATRSKHARLSVAAATRNAIIVHRHARLAAHAVSLRRAETSSTTTAAAPSVHAPSVLLSPFAKAKQGSDRAPSTKLPSTLLKPWRDDEQRTICKTLAAMRAPIWSLYARVNLLEQLSVAAPPAPPTPLGGRRLRVTVNQLKLAVDVGDTFFCALALYDTERRIKVCLFF